MRSKFWKTVLKSSLANKVGISRKRLKMNRLVTFFLLSVGILGLSAAELAPDFHASFDLDFRAQTTSGPVEGRHSIPLNMETLDTLLLKGVKGKATKIGTETVNGQDLSKVIHYPGNVLNGSSGTIAFWISPMNWDLKSGKFHALCEAFGQDGALVIAKSSSTYPKLFVFYGNATRGGNGTGYVSISTQNMEWDKGEFHHFAYTWDNDSARIFIDGIQHQKAVMPEKALLKDFSRLSLGFASVNGWKDTTGDTLIDDFQAWKRSLSVAEIEQLYASYGVAKLDKSQIPVEITQLKFLDSEDGKILNLDFSLRRTNLKSTGFQVEMEIKNGGHVVLKKTLTSPTTDYHEALIVSDLAAGEYTLQLHPVREEESDIVKDKSLVFTIGDAEPVIDHSVPEPWKPVEISGVELSSLMQKTVFSNSLLPSQLFSEKTPLLRSPMRFICNGKAIAGGSAPSVMEKHTDLLTAETSADGDGFVLKSRCRFEFDGMMWFDLTLIPNGNLEVNGAKIEIPLRSEVSTLYNCFVRDYLSFSGFHAGELKETVRRNHYKTNSDGVLPVLWMGNEERGLYYFTQDQAGRRLKNRDETVRLDPGEEGALFTINLIDYPSTLNAPVTWSFGLHVTPVRPFVRNRIFWRASSYCHPGVNVVSWFPWEKLHNVPDSRFKLDEYDTRRRHLTGNYRIPIIHYFAGFSTSPENPGYPQHAHEWSITPPAVGTAASTSDQGGYVFVCPNSASYRNSYLRGIEKCIQDLKMDNLYFDNCLSYYCSNTRHGCGWQDENGKLYPTSNVLGSRELAKGCYRIHRRIYPKGQILRHLTQTPETPIAAFSDCIMDGESFVMDVGKDENYFRVFKPDYFRASFMGVQFGQPNLFIPQFLRAYGLHFPEKVKAAKAGELKNQQLYLRHFMGYFFVHDSSPLHSYGADPNPFWKIMDEAGVTDNSPFYGYWNSRNPVKKMSPPEERVMVSTYTVEKGALVVMLNDTDNDAAVVLSIDRATFGDNPHVMDAETGEEVNLNMVKLAPRSLKFLRIR